MTRLPLRVYMLALNCASRIVPRESRTEWLKEWKAELWHIASFHSSGKIAAFAAGAFQDAYLLRSDLRQTNASRSLALGSSPAVCLLSLLLAGLASLGLAFLLPGTRTTLLPSPYHDARTLVVVSRDGSSRGTSLSISLGEFRYWQHAAQGVFSDLAFYQIVRKQLHTGHGAGVELSVGRASGDLLSLLQTSE